MFKKELRVLIPERNNTPATTLYVQMVSQNEASLKTKPYIFILPGGPGFNHSNYQDYACLTEVGTVIFHDPRGCGLSDKGNPETYTMNNYIHDINEIRKHLRIDHFIMVGKSYGAMCAVGYAITYPDQLSKLVLAAGSPSYRFIETAHINMQNRQLTKEQQAACEKLFAGALESDADVENYMNVMAKHYSYKKRHDQQTNRPIPKHPPAYQVINQGFNSFLREFNFEDKLTAIKCDTLILVGEEDWITDKQHSAFMAAHIPDSKLIIFEKADHSMESDVPEQYFGEIKKFILS